MQLQLFLENKLGIHFYYDEKSLEGNKVLVDNLYLLFPGLPQFTSKEFFEGKVNEKNAIMYVYYYGSYFSGDDFSFTNCQKSVKDAVKIANKGKAKKTFDDKVIAWRAKKIIILANSFGANPVLTSKITKDQVEKVILISPLIFVNIEDVKQIAGKKEIRAFYDFNADFLSFLKRGYKNLFRGIDQSNWIDYFSGKLRVSKIDIKEDFPAIEIIHGENDKVVNPAWSVFLKKKYSQKIKINLVKEVGHDFQKLFML